MTTAFTQTRTLLLSALVLTIVLGFGLPKMLPTKKVVDPNSPSVSALPPSPVMVGEVVVHRILCVTTTRHRY
jgi:hypothetical protein